MISGSTVIIELLQILYGNNVQQRDDRCKDDKVAEGRLFSLRNANIERLWAAWYRKDVKSN